MTNPLDLTVNVKTDVGDTAAEFDKVSRSAADMGDAVDKAGRDADDTSSRLDRVSGSAENMDDKMGKATGAMGALAAGFEVMGADKAAAALETAAMATDGLSGVGQSLSLVLELESVKHAKATAATILHTAAERTASLATKVWTGVQVVFNAVMSANPIALVVIAIAAFTAAVIIAYRKSDTFRAIVDAAFRAVKTAAEFMWTRGIKPAFEGIGRAVRTVGDLFGWLWHNAVQPAVVGISNIIAGLLDTFAGMLRAMGKVPGFGWADDAADKVSNAADKVRDLTKAMEDIPPKVTTNVEVITKQRIAGGRLPPNPVGLSRAATPTQNVTVNVQSALDPDAVAKRVQAILDRRARIVPRVV